MSHGHTVTLRGRSRYFPEFRQAWSSANTHNAFKTERIFSSYANLPTASASQACSPRTVTCAGPGLCQSSGSTQPSHTGGSANTFPVGH